MPADVPQRHGSRPPRPGSRGRRASRGRARPKTSPSQRRTDPDALRRTRLDDVEHELVEREQRRHGRVRRRAAVLHDRVRCPQAGRAVGCLPGLGLGGTTYRPGLHPLVGVEHEHAQQLAVAGREPRARQPDAHARAPDRRHANGSAGSGRRLPAQQRHGVEHQGRRGSGGRRDVEHHGLAGRGLGRAARRARSTRSNRVVPLGTYVTRR